MKRRGKRDGVGRRLPGPKVEEQDYVEVEEAASRAILTWDDVPLH